MTALFLGDAGFVGEGNLNSSTSSDFKSSRNRVEKQKILSFGRVSPRRARNSAAEPAAKARGIKSLIIFLFFITIKISCFVTSYEFGDAEESFRCGDRANAVWPLGRKRKSSITRSTEGGWRFRPSLFVLRYCNIKVISVIGSCGKTIKAIES